MPYDDYDTGEPEVVEISATTRKSRKHRRPCSYCPRPIEKGETYYRTVLKVDGEMTTLESHSPRGECAEWPPS